MLGEHMSSRRNSTIVKNLLAGAAAGFTATVPMTAAMIGLHQTILPARHRYPLPPRRITMNVARTFGVKHQLDETERKALTLAAHFGYGSAMGGLFALIAPRLDRAGGTRIPRVASGVGWGLIVWAGSYLGVLPALGLHEPATRHPARRNVLMILAHVVWGATLGLLTAALPGGAATTPARRRHSAAARSGPVERPVAKAPEQAITPGLLGS
jgi:putative membrane protein